MSELFATFGIDWRLLLIQAVNFGVLLFVLHRYLYKPILKMIDERRDMVAKGIQDAEEAARRLTEAEKDASAERAKAVQQGEGIIATARTSAEQQGAVLLTEAQTKAARTVEEAKKQAEEIMRREREAGAKELARAATLAAEKILREKHA